MSDELRCGDPGCAMAFYDSNHIPDESCYRQTIGDIRTAHAASEAKREEAEKNAANSNRVCVENIRLCEGAEYARNVAEARGKELEAEVDKYASYVDAGAEWAIKADDLEKQMAKITEELVATQDVRDFSNGEFIKSQQSLRAAEEQVKAVTKVKDGAYSERNKLVAALSKLFPASLERHEGADWEDDWRWVVFIDLPTGQASWHLHDSEVPNFDHLPRKAGRKWDGHTNDEKYARLFAIPTPARLACLCSAHQDCKKGADGGCQLCVAALDKAREGM